MKSNQNIHQTKKLFEEVFNKGDLSACNEFIADQVKLHDPAAPHLEGLDAFKEIEHAYKQAFPQKKVRIDDIFAINDKVVVRWTTQGIHQGELQGIAPTDSEFKINGISIYRFENGKISDIWQEWDRLGLLEQIGEVQPSPALH
jgi:steroid delta-isomerase-like uncharacterized protein